jgi:hypothetical protein
MSIQFSDLVKIAGITILITLGWAASVAFTFWDTHHQRLTGGKTFIWLVLVALLPFIGFLLYLSNRALRSIFSFHSTETEPKTRRETALKPFPAKRRPIPTMIASELSKQTVLDPRKTLSTQLDPPKVTGKYIFTISNGADSGKEFTFGKLPARIGRGAEASICLDGDLTVSREHAEIFELDGVLRIRDLNSSHGTHVNAIRINEKRLESGDQIQIGSTVLVVKINRNE